MINYMKNNIIPHNNAKSIREYLIGGINEYYTNLNEINTFDIELSNVKFSIISGDRCELLILYNELYNFINSEFRSRINKLGFEIACLPVEYKSKMGFAVAIKKSPENTNHNFRLAFTKFLHSSLVESRIKCLHFHDY